MFAILHAQLTTAGIPVVGVSGKPSDRSTWRVDFAPEATDEQKARAAQIVAAFDVEKAEHNAAIDAQIAALEARITTRMLVDAAAGTPYPVYLDLVQQISALRSKRAA